MRMRSRIISALKQTLLLLGCCMMSMQTAAAVSLGKIEVASHLGEPFFAQIALHLTADESLSRDAVSVATPTDYNIFEVYRDDVVDQISVNLVHSQQGDQIRLESKQPIHQPFFNLILKIRAGRVSRFKKYPVMLDLPTVAAASLAQPATSPKSTASAPEAASSASGVSNWARIQRYGPIVHGDTLSTVAERLRVDQRYSRKQVMVALFEKNRSAFDQQNMNLMKADSFLDVPTAAEVERHDRTAAAEIYATHAKAWQQLKHLPRYAKEAEAQKHRYTTRISVGEMAVGERNRSTSSPTPTAAKPTVAQSPASSDNNTSATPAPSASPKSSDQTPDQRQLAALAEQNRQLQQQLLERDQVIAALKSNLPASKSTPSADERRIKHLEIMLAQMQQQLQQERARHDSLFGDSDTQRMLILGLAALVVLLLIALLLQRKQRRGSTATPDAPSAKESAAVTEAQDKAEQAEPAVRGQPVDQPVEPPAPHPDSVPTAAPAAEPTPEPTPERTTEAVATPEPTPAPREAAAGDTVDHLVEAAAYLRYGMDEEALQQLDLAIAQQPDRPDAYVKKAELLSKRGEQQMLQALMAAATAALSISDLEQVKRVVEPAAAVSMEAMEIAADALQADSVEGVLTPSANETDADSDETDNGGLDFNLSDLDAEALDALSALEETAEQPAEADAGDLDFTVAEEGSDSGDRREETLDETHKRIATIQPVEDHNPAHAEPLEMPSHIAEATVDLSASVAAEDDLEGELNALLTELSDDDAETTTPDDTAPGEVAVDLSATDAVNAADAPAVDESPASEPLDESDPARKLDALLEALEDDDEEQKKS